MSLELCLWNYLDDYDLDRSSTIDELDIHIVNNMKNIEWINIFNYIDTENNIICGITNYFSIFRGR